MTMDYKPATDDQEVIWDMKYWYSNILVAWFFSSQPIILSRASKRKIAESEKVSHNPPIFTDEHLAWMRVDFFDRATVKNSVKKGQRYVQVAAYFHEIRSLFLII